MASDPLNELKARNYLPKAIQHDGDEFWVSKDDYDAAIAIIRQHEAERPEDAIGRVAAAILLADMGVDYYLMDNDADRARPRRIAWAAISAMGDTLKKPEDLNASSKTCEGNGCPKCGGTGSIADRRRADSSHVNDKDVASIDGAIGPKDSPQTADR